jgi:hypothetical protein
MGTVLIFDHRVRHCSAMVTCGIKRLVKFSVLYASVAEDASPTGQLSVTDADRDVRLPFRMAALSAVRGVAEKCTSIAHGTFMAHPPLATRTLDFVGTKKDEFNALVKRADSKTDSETQTAAREQLLDFIVQHDLSSWPREVVGRAFMAMTMALNDSRLKLWAYQAFDAATQLHEDERCVLLGETLIKDSRDQDAHVRLAAINASFKLFPDETCRESIVKHAITHDSSSSVRARALEGLVALSEKAARYETAALRSEASHVLLKYYEEDLRRVAALDDTVDAALAIQAMTLLSASASELDVSSAQALLD